MQKYKDPWKHPDMIRRDASGEGFLFYPNPDKSKPPPSIRAELVRDGFEDYDLFTLLREAVSRAEADPQTDAKVLERARALLRFGGVVWRTDRYSMDPTVYETRHREMLEVLHALAATT